MREFNQSFKPREQLYTRAREADDHVFRGRQGYTGAQQEADKARVAWQTEAAEDPKRRAPLIRQVLLALLFVGLDGVACDFAAQAAGAGQTGTLFIASLFLGALVAGEVLLDAASRRWARRTWRWIAMGLACYIVGLGALRFYYLVTTGSSLVSAVIGAVLLTTATGLFVALGYRALRTAETTQAYRLRRLAKAATRHAKAMSEAVEQSRAERDRLVDAYISLIRPYLIEAVADRPANVQSGELQALEAAVQAHLTPAEAR
jgi:hypothetical protein